MASLSESISAALSIATSSFGRLAPPAVLLAVLTLVSAVYSEIGSRLTAAGYTGVFAPYVTGTAFWIESVLMLVLTAIVMTWLLSICFDLVRGTPQRRFSWVRALWMMLLSLIGTIAYVLVLTLMIVIAGLAIYLATKSGIGVAILVILGMLAVDLVIGVASAYLVLRLGVFAEVSIVDTGANPFAAMRESWRRTTGRFWWTVLLALVMMAFNMIGLMVLGVGLVFTLPLTLLILVHYYDSIAPRKARVSRVKKA